MSMYRKFIESATLECGGVGVGQLMAPHEDQLSVIKHQHQQDQEAAQPNNMTLARRKSRAHLAAAHLSPLASVVGSTISSSTPLTKHQYKRLVEASDLDKTVDSRQPLDNFDRHHQNNFYCVNQQQNHQQFDQHHHHHHHQAAAGGLQYHDSQSSHNIRCRAPVAPPSQPSYQAQRCLSLANIQRQQASNQSSPNIYELHGQAAHQRHRQRRQQQQQQQQQAIYNQDQQQQQTAASSSSSIFRTNDPVLLEWMRAMRFETELECLTALQARTLAIDEHAAIALSVRNSQVAIQEMRLESDMTLSLLDCLIDSLPVSFNTIDKFAIDFSELYVKLLEQTSAQVTASNNRANAGGDKNKNNYIYCNQLDNNHNSLTIINCTPRKLSLASARTLKPLDKLAIQIRQICIEMAQLVHAYQDNYQGSLGHIDNGNLEAMLRKIKELLGKFVEISIRAECANIVRALEHDFGRASSTRAAGLADSRCSTASLRPVRPFESSTAQLPLKWALIALWQLTKDDGYICRTLTEKWQTAGRSAAAAPGELPAGGAQKPRSARRLDYSTKYDTCDENNNPLARGSDHSLRSDYEKLYQICQNNEQFREKQHALMMNEQRQQQHEQHEQQQQQRQEGALSSALKSKQQQLSTGVRQVSTIELLIDIIISQPNRHERIDMINFVHENKLVDVEEGERALADQSISAAFYTSNQYKVAALRILNHLCINEQAVKTILKCFSTPPPGQGQPVPENKIIKSIFECYQTAQEHIYANETMFNPSRTPRRARKRARRQDETQAFAAPECEEYSDYGSRQTTNSAPTSASEFAAGVGGSLADPDESLDDDDDDEGGDAVVKEAIRLLIQLTTPFYRSNQGQDYYTLIGRFSIESLVKYLTNIIKSAKSREMLLLSFSALANISFITTEPMKQYGTNRVILDMFRGSKSRSKDLELRDQTVTILANAADRNLLDIVSNGGLVFLLSCLEICPTRMSNYKLPKERLKGNVDLDTPYSQIDEESDATRYGHEAALGSMRRVQLDNRPRDRKPIDLGDEFLDDLDCACDNQQTLPAVQLTCLSCLTVGEMAALERIHQKTAVAFARMASDPSTTRMVLKCGGIKQMIDLCKLSHKRNHSDTVLIACLAALRKISKVIGRDAFRHYNALDLIDLELERALEIYGRLYASEV